MPLKIFRHDITQVEADAIVNSANPHPIIGGGSEAAIYEAAGKKELLAERKKIGDINPGDTAVTPAFALKAKYIIHTVGPVWEGGTHGEAAILSSCYENSLERALDLGCKSIAFPFISAGTYGFPKDKAIEVATTAINRFLRHNKMKVILVVFDKESFSISGKKFRDVTAFLEVSYFEEKVGELCGNSPEAYRRNRRLELEHQEKLEAQKNGQVPDDVSEMLKQSQASFSARVLKMVKERGLAASELYNKNYILTKKIYSDMKIQGDNYRPKKGTAILFCLALELDLDETLSLLESAGWTLSDSKRMDIIVKWHILQKDYNVNHVNETLRSFGYSDLDKYDK